MKILRNEKGFALVFVMILAVIALVMTLAMLFMVARGSYVSGQQKRYRSAVEASQGGAEAMMEAIVTRGIGMPPYDNLLLNASLAPKLDNSTHMWASSLDNSISIDPNTSSTYDMTLRLGSYLVYVKVADTVYGNSAPSSELLNKGVSPPQIREYMPPHVPYLYTIEVLSQSTANPTERSKLSVLYQY